MLGVLYGDRLLCAGDTLLVRDSTRNLKKLETVFGGVLRKEGPKCETEDDQSDEIKYFVWTKTARGESEFPGFWKNWKIKYL